jgi:hypothetical protein
MIGKHSLLVLLLLLLATAGCRTADPDPQPTNRQTAVVEWNRVALAAVRAGAPRPPVVSRFLFMLHSAIYDAWAMYDDTAVPTVLDADLKRPNREHSEANKQAAVSYAAYYILVEFYPEYEMQTQAFSRLLNNLGYPVLFSTDVTTPAGVGLAAAQAVLDDRLHDGSNMLGNYADMTSDVYPLLYTPVNSADPNSGRDIAGEQFNPNRWQPLRIPTGQLLNAQGVPIVDGSQATSFTDQRFLTPHWGAVRPFGLATGSQFRPAPPPIYGSNQPYTDGLGRTMTNDEAYRLQFTEVLSISGNLTDAQKAIADYWADGPRTETPPGHWNALAHGVSLRDNHTLDEDVKLYFALNAALFDASIACWEAKRAYDFIRPQSAIRFLYQGQMVQAWGGPDRGTQSIRGEEWRPYQLLSFVTPPFSEYTSGHSTFSAAAAEVLTRFTGSNQFYDGVTVSDEDYNRDGLLDMVGEYVVPIGGSTIEKNHPTEVIILRWPTFHDAAYEAGISRLYGGIHIQDGNLRGREMGEQVGVLAYEHAERYWSGHAE